MAWGAIMGSLPLRRPLILCRLVAVQHGQLGEPGCPHIIPNCACSLLLQCLLLHPAPAGATLGEAWLPTNWCAWELY